MDELSPCSNWGRVVGDELSVGELSVGDLSSYSPRFESRLARCPGAARTEDDT